jgi:hypothetical protein
MLNLARNIVSLALVIIVDGIPYDDPEQVTKRLIEMIQERAIYRWNKRRWLAEITKVYCQIYQAKGEAVTPQSRRRQIQRVFEVQSCNLETAIALATCVGCKVQLQCFESSTRVL